MPSRTRRLAAARARHHRHPGVDRRAGPARGRDRARPRRVGERGRAGPLGARRARRSAVSLAIGPLIDRIGVRPLIVRGAGLAFAGAVAHRGGALAGALLRRPRGHRGWAWPACCRRGSPAWPRSFDDARRAVGDGLRGGRAVGGLDRRATRSSGCWPTRARGGCRTRCRPRSRLAALAAGLAAPRTRDAVAARRRGAVGRAGLGGRVPRPLGAPLDDRRAGGLLGLDRRADLRRRLLHPELRRVGEARSACCWRSGSVVFLVTSLNTAAAHQPVRAPAADLVGAAVGMGVMLIPMLNLTPSAVWARWASSACWRCFAARALDRLERARASSSCPGARAA